MGKLVSVKIDKATRDKLKEPSTIATDAPIYPWGLSINLDSDTLEKLEVDADDLKVGATLSLIAKVDVVSLSKNESQGSTPNQSVGLQITEMCLESAGAAAAAVKLYKEK